MKTFAGIVTFNPDLERLEENLSAVSSQVDVVILFDNGSKNRTELLAFLKGKSFPVRTILHDTNAGMSVALNALCRDAKQAGAADILLLDQDSVVSEEFVNTLAAYRTDDIGLLCPFYRDRNDAVQRVASEGLEDLDGAITSGSLVNLTAWEAVGGYDENLFVDWVDYEFCDNLIVHGYRIVRVNDAVLLHEIGHKDFKRIGWSFNPWDGFVRIPIYTDEKPYFRRYDVMRGHGYVTLKYRHTKVWKHEEWMLIADSLHNLLYERHRIQFLKAAITGLRDGRRAARTNRNL